MAIYSYPAIAIKQTEESQKIVLFAAPARNIKDWSGVPQKKSMADTETAGFQRSENKDRIDKIAKFYGDSKNVVQNPLLGAIRTGAIGSVEFVPGDVCGISCVETGEIKINIPDDDLSLLELLELMKSYLENRIVDLATRAVPDGVVAKLRSRLAGEGNEPEDTDQYDIDENGSNGSNEDDSSSMEIVVNDESHILDFWDEVVARIQLVQETEYQGDDFLGFSRDALLAYLKPVILVDGQHRLGGALHSLKTKLDSDELAPKIEEMIDSGDSPVDAREKVALALDRKLPISLLLDDDPAMHVFQFIIVNQKATPIGKPLLGTIVSTTLSNEELESVGERLEAAGIEIDNPRAVSSLIRDPRSPFHNLVERGLEADAARLLNWSVFSSLVKTFRTLSGAKIYGDRSDYARLWRQNHLEDSMIITDWGSGGFADELGCWSDLHGPWRDVFISFWTCIRDRFASVDDSESYNYWGNPRQSNLFNKISLNILAADFFVFLRGARKTLDDAQSVEALCEDWLDGVSDSYFSRDWNLGGVKKESTGIRKRWARNWQEYRNDPSRLPQVNSYRNPLAD